jgi:hypothetical protein
MLSFSFSLDVIYGGLGISELQFLINKIPKNIFVSSKFFVPILVIQMLDPDPGPQ